MALVESNFVDHLEWKQVTVSTEWRKKLIVDPHSSSSEQDRKYLLDLISSQTGYEGFGSFRSKNVEDLMAQQDKDYHSPSIPFFALRILSKSEISQASYCSNDAEENSMDKNMHRNSNHDSIVMDKRSFSFLDIEPNLLSALMKKTSSLCSFGSFFKMEHFLISPNIIFVNHGAFGSALAGALEMKHELEKKMENEVVDFVDRELLPLIVYSTRKLCSFFNSSRHQLVLLQNATFAMNSALRIIQKEDVVAYFDTEYLAVYKALWYRCQEVGAALHEISLNSFLHNEAVLGNDESLTAYVCSQLPLGCTTLVLDHISSTSAICFPVFSHLIPAVRRADVKKIIVDGAHAPLQVELNFRSLPEASQPTVYMGNFHKWFCSPKSLGFMWVHEDFVSVLSSVIRSHGAGEGLLSEFIWDGTKDYSPYFTLPPLIDFWNAQGVDRVRHYCSTLLESASSMLTESFHSRRPARHSPFMSLVELPEALQPRRTEDVGKPVEEKKRMSAMHIQDVLHDFFLIEVPVKEIEGRYYIRISVFVYNTPSDYVYLKEAISLIASLHQCS